MVARGERKGDVKGERRRRRRGEGSIRARERRDGTKDTTQSSTARSCVACAAVRCVA